MNQNEFTLPSLVGNNVENSIRESFIHELTQNKESEFLLHALTKLACVQPQHSHLPLIILNELFYVACM
jgi:hypothetical protein